MPRKAKVRWCATGNAWRSDVGPYGRPNAAGKARRTPVYFRQIPRTERGRRLAEEQLERYLRDRDRRAAEATSEASDLPVLDGIVGPYLDAVAAKVREVGRSEKTLRSHRERLRR
jgi:hypothetical protein